METFGVVTLENVERVAPLKANPTSSDPVLRPHPDLGEGEVTSEMSVRGVGLSPGKLKWGCPLEELNCLFEGWISC